jgi:hypothetical protein
MAILPNYPCSQLAPLSPTASPAPKIKLTQKYMKQKNRKYLETWGRGKNTNNFKRRDKVINNNLLYGENTERAYT